MIRSTSVFLAILFLSSCHYSNKTEGFTKQSPGLEYKLAAKGDGGTPQPGQFIKMNVRQVYNDSVLSDTRDRLPQYQKFDSAEMSKESYRIFSKAKVGDSLVFKVPSDSAFKQSKPAFAKKKGWLYTYVTIVGIMDENEARADLDMEKAKRGMDRRGTE